MIGYVALRRGVYRHERVVGHIANSAAIAIQITTITAPAIRLTGLPWDITSCARARHSAKTEGGTILIAKAIPIGIRIRSSRYPRTGTKSGIRSMGLNA